MARYISVLTIAGSDCSGGAGIQADIKTISALGLYAASAITALTVQDARGVREVRPVGPDIVGDQIKAVMEYLSPKAVKIGMVCNVYIIDAIVKALSPYPHVPIVIDPVIAASDGTSLISTDALALFKKRLLPMASLITPNLPEAYVLSGIKDDIGLAARLLLDMCENVLIKGGHSSDTLTASDTLFCRDSSIHKYTSSRVASANTHGTGCTLSSAIASFVALGYDIPKACFKAKRYIAKAIQEGADVDFGIGAHGSLNHLFKPQRMIKI